MVTWAGLKSEFRDVWCYLRAARMWKVVIWCQRGPGAGFGWDRVGFTLRGWFVFVLSTG